MFFQICHLTIHPIFSTHYSTHFYTQFSEKISSKLFHTIFPPNSLYPICYTIFLHRISTQFFHLKCVTKLFHTICQPYFSPNFSTQLFQPHPPPQFVQYQIDYFFGNILLCPLSFKCHLGQLCSLCGGYVISVTVERYFWHIIHF